MSENRLKIGVSEETGSVWLKISRTRGRQSPPPTIFSVRKLDKWPFYIRIFAVHYFLLSGCTRLTDKHIDFESNSVI